MAITTVKTTVKASDILRRLADLLDREDVSKHLAGNIDGLGMPLEEFLGEVILKARTSTNLIEASVALSEGRHG